MNARHALTAVLCMATFYGTALAQQAGSGNAKPADPPPGWEALAETAEELALRQYSTEDLEAQAAQKHEHLDELFARQAELEAQMATIYGASGQALEEIDAIADPLLRDESLVRFRGAKDVRLKTVQAALTSINEAIAREQREMAMLNRLLQGRRAEARLHGVPGPAPSSYAALVHGEAARIRASEADIAQQLRAQRLERVKELVLPAIAPRVPDLADAVMASDA